MMETTFKADCMAGRNVFLAGATSGINLGVAERFAEEGASVYVISRNPEKVDATLAKLTDIGARASGMAVDVRNYDAVETAFADAADRYGELDFVLAGAAGNFTAAAAEMSSNAFKTVMDIDVLGSYNVFRASYPHLRKPGASLVAISAPQGENAYVMQSHVCAAKAGVNMLMKCLALEWGPQGIRVNAISPGPIAGTEGMKRLAPTPEAEAAVKRKVPLRAFGHPRDIADGCLYLASDAARYVTGALIYIDGGLILGDGEF